MTSLAAEIHFASLRALKKYFFKMVNKCCIVGCDNFTCLKEGVSVHGIPYSNNDNPEAKRRKRWIDFVRARRDKWNREKHHQFAHNIFVLGTTKKCSTFFPAKKSQPVGFLSKTTLTTPQFSRRGRQSSPRSWITPQGTCRQALERKVSNSLSDINTIFQ